MRKLIVMVMIIIMVIASASIGYGQVAENIVEPRYISVAYCTSYFNIDANGNAEFTLAVCPRNLELLDQVKATIKIVNQTTGAIVYNQTKTLAYMLTYDEFRLSDAHTLVKSGIYECQVTFKCYKNGVLLETIAVNPQMDAF